MNWPKNIESTNYRVHGDGCCSQKLGDTAKCVAEGLSIDSGFNRQEVALGKAVFR